MDGEPHFKFPYKMGEGGGTFYKFIFVGFFDTIKVSNFFVWGIYYTHS